MKVGQQFNHQGERFQITLIGPVTCLCAVFPSCEEFRFTTRELIEILRNQNKVEE